LHLSDQYVRKGSNLYLACNTLEIMRQRDAADGADYRQLRNRAAVLVRRDKQKSNMDILAVAKAKGDSSTLWDHLANSDIGKPKTDALPSPSRCLTARP
jgi:hypothetical protein